MYIPVDATLFVVTLFILYIVHIMYTCVTFLLFIFYYYSCSLLYWTVT